MHKLIGALAFVFMAVLIGSWLYFNRSQEIDFSTRLPKSLELCGKDIENTNIQYKALENWLRNNSKDWKNTPVTYVPNLIYSSDMISINVMQTAVIVNYENGSNWSQVAKGGNTEGLYIPCK